MDSLKKSTLLISALSVGTAIVLLGYSAYGWFSMNREVRATGMNLSVSAPNNLEISSTGIETDYHQTVAIDLKRSVETLTAGDNADGRRPFDYDADSFSLLPASSFEGLSMWETNSAYVTGEARCTPEGFTNADGRTVKYNTQHKAFEGYYIDVPLWIRTAAQQDPTNHPGDYEIVLNKAQTAISKVTGNDDVVKVVRAAFLNGDASDISYKLNTGFTDSLVLADADSDTGLVVTNGVSPFSTTVQHKYITFDETKSNQTICTLKGVNYNNTFKYTPTKITVRIWIEGQDRYCLPTIGMSSFNLDLGFAVK